MTQAAASCRATYIGTATLLLEIDGVRILTDPALDPAGGEYSLEPAPGIKIRSRKLTDPALSREELGAIAAVLLSHDEHFDNLDRSGRELLRDAGQTITTPAASRRIGGPAVGLAPWESITVGREHAIRVTAVPARHGPQGTEELIGDTTGFVLEWNRQRDGALYISGDTVWFEALAEIGERFDITTAVLHLGAAGFEVAGDVRFSLDAAAGARLATAVGARRVVPVHYEGWTHFTEPAEQARAVLAAELGDRVSWLQPGRPTDLTEL